MSTPRPLMRTIFHAPRPVRAPTTVEVVPSAAMTLTSSTERWVTDSVAVPTEMPTPRSSAMRGALTKVTGSSTIRENRPRAAARPRTSTSSVDSSPRAVTSTLVGAPSSRPPATMPSSRASSSHRATSSPGAAGDVYGVRHEVAGQGQQDGLGDVDARAILRLLGGGAQVRRHDGLRQLEQRGVGARLRGVDVEARTADVAGLDGVGQGLLVDEAAAGRVDDDLALLRLRQEVGVEHAGRLLGLGQVDGDEVGAGDQLIELDELDASCGRAPGWRTGRRR